MRTYLTSTNIRRWFAAAGKTLLFGGAIAAMALPASAADLTWGSGGAGGAGTWDTGITSNWYNGSADTTWTDGDNATFGGTASDSVHVVAAGVTVGNMNFTTAGYEIWNNNITLNGPTTTISVVSGSLPGALLGMGIHGTSDIIKTGPGSLGLYENNSFSGAITVRQGTLVSNYGAALGNANNTLTLGDSGTGAGDIVALYMGPGINSEAMAPQLASISTSNYGAAQAIVLATSDALGLNNTALFANLNLAGSKPLTMKSETGTPGVGGNHGSAQDWKGTITGSGIAAGTTALTLDGTAYDGSYEGRGALRLSFGGVSTTDANSFTGDVLIKGKVSTQGTTHSGNDAAHQNLGFASNNVTVDAGAQWNTVWGGETVQKLDGSGDILMRPLRSAGTGIGLTVGNNDANGGVFSGAIHSQVDGGFDPSFGVKKVGTGTQTFSGANDYNGVTQVEGGTLLLNGTHTGGGAYTVSSGATLGGTGTTASAVTVDGTIAPGTSIGTLNVGNTTLNGNYLLETASGSSSDLLNVTGSLTLGAGSVLDLDSLSSLVANETYTIAAFTGSLTGTFGTVDPVITATHLVNYGLNAITLSPVPEPSSLALLLLGSVGVGMLRRRKK